jgi:hypothetical protein
MPTSQSYEVARLLGARDLKDAARAVIVFDEQRVRGVVNDDAAILARKVDELRELRARRGRAGRVVRRAEEDDVCAASGDGEHCVRIASTQQLIRMFTKAESLTDLTGEAYLGVDTGIVAQAFSTERTWGAEKLEEDWMVRTCAKCSCKRARAPVRGALSSSGKNPFSGVHGRYAMPSNLPSASLYESVLPISTVEST